MTTKNIIITSFLSLAILAAIGINSAYAHGWWGGNKHFSSDSKEVAEKQVQRFQHQADMLEVGVDKVKQYWVQGMNMRDMAQDMGIDHKEMQNRMQQEKQEHRQDKIDTLVEEGVITQEQADSRLETDLTHSKKKSRHQSQRGHGMHEGCPMMK